MRVMLVEMKKAKLVSGWLVLSWCAWFGDKTLMVVVGRLEIYTGAMIEILQHERLFEILMLGIYPIRILPHTQYL